MSPILLVPLSVLVLLAAGRDLAERSIPNKFIAAGLLLAVAAHLLSGSSGWVPLAGLAVGFFLFLPMYLARGMGAGDVKLMGVVGAFAGPALALHIVLASCLAGGALALGYLSAARSSRKSRMPYGPAIAIGTLAALALRYHPG